MPRRESPRTGTQTSLGESALIRVLWPPVPAYNRDGVRSLDLRDGGDLPIGNRLHEGLVIALVAVGVCSGELGDRAVEPVAFAEVGGDRNPVSGPSLRARQR